MTLFWALVMLTLLLISSAGLAYMRAEYLDKGRSLVASYAHVMDEQTTRIFQTTDQRLQLAQQELLALTSRGQLSTATANGVLTAQRIGQSPLNRLWALDTQGKILYDTEPGTAGLSLADREFFNTHLRMDNSEMFVDNPTLSRRTGRWQLTMSRALRGPHGQLEGVIAAAIEPSFLESEWNAIDVGPNGLVALLRQNGTLLMSSPFAAEAIGTDWSHSPPFTTHLPIAAHGIYIDRSSTDGIARTMAYRTLPATQMVLVVGASHPYLLQPWYTLLQAFAAAFVTVAVILAWLFYLLGKSWLRRYVAEELAQDNERTWQSMFEQSPVAQLLQLPFSTIVNVNDKFVVLTGYRREELVGAIANDLGLRVDDALSARFVTTLKTQGRVTDMELHGKRRDGTQRLLLVSSAPIAVGGIKHHLHSFVDVTEHRNFQEQARIDQSALAAISQGVLIAGPDRKAVSVNAAFERLTGYTGAELIGKSCSMLQGPRTDPATILAIREALDDKRPFSGEILNYRKDGTPFWNALFINPVWSTDNQFSCYVGVHSDVTERKLHEQQLQLTEQVFSQGLEGIIVTDAHGDIIRVNRAFTKITGYTEAEVLGKNPRMLQSGIQSRDYYQKMWRTLASEGVWSGEVFNRHKDGTVYPEWLTISAIRDANGVLTHYLGSFNDLSQMKAAESRIQRLSHFDPLTGLPNRSLLQDRTAHAISMVQRNKEPLCMMLVSIDHFKTINDTLGHHVGDDLLIGMGKRLSACVRDQDTVSHLSGKEFVLILPGTPPEGAAHLATELLWKLAQPHHVGEHALEVTASIGVASFPDNGNDFDTLFKSVEIAMHRAQSSGRDNFKFYSDGMYQEVLERDSMTKALRQAAERGELQVLYQPLGDLQTGKISGMEALLRWHHPERGTISPTVFIPIAEESGLICSVGEWVLGQVCRDIRCWLDKGIAVPHVAVNVSPLQLREQNFVVMVQSVLSQQAIDPQLIHLEVTESALMEDADRCEAMLQELKALGFSLSLDDFGTGYSSLSYLKRYPFDKVKIDQSFVRDLGQNQTDAVIVKVIISMAHGLGLKVIAEGVETEAQCEIMRTNVCDEIQGFFFSRPVDAATLESLLIDGRKLPAHLLRFRKQQRTLLLVDDEPNVISSLKRLLRRDGHTILSASSGAEGLELLQKNKVDIIISDQRMPGMTGVEFLREAKLRHPNTIRMVLSGYTELQSVTDAINEGAIYRFLTKPWDDAQLRDQVEKAFEHKELMEENQQLDMKIRTTNQELVAANRHLGNVIHTARKQVEVEATSLAIVQEALEYVPIPVIGLDDEGVFIFINAAAERLFQSRGPLLGADMAIALPELAAAMTAATPSNVAELAVNGQAYQLCWNTMGQHSRARGKLVTLARREDAP
jgi:diguanylate cyclase (GGDEF)-like protein/PAS domain S-box-containing protein